jgi:glycine betaine/proline transport system substrate-binding protein
VGDEKNDVRFLNDPKAIFSSPQSYYWIGTAGFSAANPAAREAIASVYVPLADITAINGAMNEGKSTDEAVADWVAAHADLIGRWTAIKSQ